MRSELTAPDTGPYLELPHLTKTRKGKAMRRTLGKLNGERKTFCGTFERSGTKPSYRSGLATITILLKDIRDVEGNVVCDHLWFNYTKGFQALFPLKNGDVIQFDARVTTYTKGYFGHKEEIQIEKAFAE